MRREREQFVRDLKGYFYGGDVEGFYSRFKGLV